MERANVPFDGRRSENRQDPNHAWQALVRFAASLGVLFAVVYFIVQVLTPMVG